MYRNSVKLARTDRGGSASTTVKVTRASTSTNKTNKQEEIKDKKDTTVSIHPSVKAPKLRVDDNVKVQSPKSNHPFIIDSLPASE